MAQNDSPGRWLVQGIGLCLGAWIIFNMHKAPPNLSADIRDFDNNPTCREARVLEAPAPPLDRPILGECVLQSVAVVNKNQVIHFGRGAGRGPTYTITLLMPWGGQHSVTLRGDKHAFNGISVGRPINALLYGHRIALLAVNGRAISTTENPQVDRLVQVMRWIGTGVLLVAGLFSFYRLTRSGLSN